MDAHLILIHGAWAGPWVWDTITEPLLAAGVKTRAVRLPGVGQWAPGAAVGLDDLVASVVDQIADLDGTIVLAGHSGGGIIATQVAEQLADRIAGVAYVAGMMLPSGVSYRDLCDDLALPQPVGVGGYLQPTADGLGSSVSREAAAAIFFQRADAGAAIIAARRLVPQLDSARFIAPTWTHDRFGSIPRLYIEAVHDRSLPLAAQRRMQELTPGAQVAVLESDHAPQLSKPDDLATVLASFTHSLTTATSPTGATSS